MTMKEEELEWLRYRTERYHSTTRGDAGLVEDLGEEGKMGQAFSSVDKLEVDIGSGAVHQLMFINTSLMKEQKEKVCALVQEFIDCFAWEYTKMTGLSRELVEHKLPIKLGFRPHKQLARNFNPKLYSHIKEEVERLLKANFIQPCRYAEWVSNIVPVEKKNTYKIRICVDFRFLNRATLKDEYPIPNADMLVNSASGKKVISFLDGNAGYNQIFMATEDVPKTAFRCPGFVGLFEWVVMTFGFKYAGATYQRAMNMSFHDLLDLIVEVYIDVVVVKSSGFEQQLVDLHLAFERMRKYGLRMNPLKCAFGVSAGQFLSFIIHENGIEVDPKR
jgi:hypothetical protein